MQEYLEGDIMNSQSRPFDDKFTVQGTFGNDHGLAVEIKADIAINQIGIDSPMIALRGPRALKKEVLNIIMGGETRFSGKWEQDNYAHNILFIANGILNLWQPEGETDVICSYHCNELVLEQFWRSPEKYKPTDAVLGVDYSLPKTYELSMPVDLLKEAERQGIAVERMAYETPIGQMSILPLRKSDSLTLGKRSGAFQYVDTLMHFETKDEELNFDDFLKQANSIVDDYLDIISMIAQRRIQYFKVITQYFSSDPIEKFQTHRYYYRDEHSPIPRARLIEWQVTHKLLKEIVPKYSNHNNKSELHHTLNLFLTGVQSEVAETKLIWLQNALEAVIDGLGVATELCSECGAPKKSLRERLFLLANAESSYFKDLYPTLFPTIDGVNKTERTFPFIKIRNDLSHGRITNYSMDFVSEELDRLQLLFERLLCKWIGVDCATVPYLKDTPHIKAWSGNYA